MRAKRRQGATVFSSGRVFNDWLSRARADIALLTTELPTGPYPYAGIPWFSTAFGRDGVISALQMLWLDPALARGVLAFLAQHQATETSPFSDSQPGKIMHETRKGEMAVLRELPFGRYYGGVDTTPLYIYLASAYAARTGDMAFIDTLWPSLVAAAAWMEDAGKQDGSGFVSLSARRRIRAFQPGLEGQLRFGLPRRRPHPAKGRSRWSRCRAMSTPPIADWPIWRRGARMPTAAAHWTACAERIRAAVERSFWMEDAGFYALALDGDGKPCQVRSSNAGHLLYAGLPSPERAQRLTNQLLAASIPFRLGRAHARRRRAAVQPNVLSQRLDLAA